MDRDSVQCITLKNRAILKWRTGYVKTIPIYLQNVFTLQLATGKKRFLAYCTEVGYDPYQNDENPDIMVQVQEAPLEINLVASDYDPINSQSVPQESTPTEGEPTSTEGDPININGNKPKPNLLDTSTNSLEKKKENDSAELLRMHFKFGHIEFESLRQMAKVGMLLTRISECDILTCAAFLCGKVHKQPKITKHKRAIQKKEITKPG